MGKKRLFLDLETSGFMPRFGAGIVEASVVDENGDLVYSSLAKPYRKIPATATKVHGISNEDVANAPSSAEVANAVYRVCDGAVVGIYNSAFDLRFLPRLPAVAEVFCMMKLVKQATGNSLSLSKAVAHFGLSFSSDAHRAAEDARMTARVYRAICAEAKQAAAIADKAPDRPESGLRINNVSIEALRDRVFKSWGEVPKALVSRTELKRRGLKPGGVSFATVHIERGHRYRIGVYHLFLVSEAKPL